MNGLGQGMIWVAALTAAGLVAWGTAWVIFLLAWERLARKRAQKRAAGTAKGTWHTHWVPPSFAAGKDAPGYVASTVTPGNPPHTHQIRWWTSDRTEPGGVDGHRHRIVWMDDGPVLRSEVEVRAGGQL